MSEPAQHQAFVAATVATTTARMPLNVEVDGVALSLRPAISGGDHASFVGTWSSAGGTGDITVDVSRAGGSMSLLDVSLSPASGGMRARLWSAPRRAAIAAALATALLRAVEGRPTAVVPRSQPRRHRVIRVAVPAAAAVVVALAVVAANLFAPPKPVSLEAATARFRESAATPAAAHPAKTGPTSVAGRVQTVKQTGNKQRPERTRPESQGSSDPGTTQVAVAFSGRQRPDRRPAQQRARTTGVVPDEGVYRYQTDGYEELDVPNGHREFPEESTQTIRHTECGHIVRWDPMEQRWDENSLCPRNGMSQPVEFHTYREFFGRSVEQHFTCKPLPTPRGAMWAQRCRSDDTTMTTVARSLGLRTMTVDGTQVEVQGLQTDSRLQGANTGTRRGQLWHARDTGVMVHTEVQGQLESEGPFGRVHYREQYTLHLASFEAHR